MADPGDLLAMSLACCAILGGAAVHAYALDGGFVESAVYEAETGELTINFREPINQFSIYVSRVSVQDVSGIASMSVSEFIRVDGDGHSVVFEPAPSNRNLLAVMEDPTLHLEPGAFERAADGTRSEAEEAPLTVTGDILLEPDPEGLARDLVVRAEYDGGANNLVLYFGKEIDPLAISVSRIAILHNGCDGISLSAQELAWVDDDGRSVVFELDPDNRQTLYRMIDPWVHLRQGAFVVDTGRAASGSDDVQLSIDGSPPAPLDPQSRGIIGGATCGLTYMVEPPSSILDVSDYGAAFVAEHTRTVLAAVRDGLHAWSEFNPGISFREIRFGTPDIMIRWIDYDGDHLGVACLGCLGTGAFIEAVLEEPDCRGDPVAYDHGTIRNIVTHEFGHNLGLEHHADRGHLMYPKLSPSSAAPAEDDLDPSEYGIQIPYDTLGYEIPGLLPSYLAGERDLLDRYNEAAARFHDLEGDYDAAYDAYRSADTAYNDARDRLLSAVAELGLAVDDQNVIHLPSREAADIINPLVEELNRKAEDLNSRLLIVNSLADDRNSLLSVVNATASQLRCMQGSP